MNADGGIRARLRELTSRQQHFERYLAGRLDIDAAGLTVMDHLARNGSATPTEMARELEISTAAMTLVINRLEASGHVTRAPHPSDRRKIVVTPADHSIDFAYELVRPFVTAVGDLTDSMTAAETAAVTTFLDRLLEIYASLGDGRATRS